MSKELAEHQRRVIAEHAELSEKIEKLTAFMVKSDVFPKLPEKERELLIEQRIAMLDYQRALAQRIERF